MGGACEAKINKLYVPFLSLQHHSLFGKGGPKRNEKANGLKGLVWIKTPALIGENLTLVNGANIMGKSLK